MAASNAVAASGTTIGWADTDTTISTTIAELVDWSGIGNDIDFIDVTHTTSPSGAREFIAGLKQGLEPSLSIQYNRTDAGAIEPVHGVTKFWRINFVNSDYVKFQAAVKTWEITGSNGDKIEASVTLKITKGVADFVSGS